MAENVLHGLVQLQVGVTGRSFYTGTFEENRLILYISRWVWDWSGWNRTCTPD
jgi:hypothetical protein